jgi:hypothetical protein
LAEQAAQLENLERFGVSNVFVRVWFIPLGDKAHTWNEYIHRIWELGDVAYFIDGYARVRPDALMLIDEGLRSVPNALAATGVPTSGRSADALRRQMLKEGGIHGNLHAIRGSVLATLKQRGFRMPLGLYRTDSLIGAVLMFRLDPAQHEWDPNCMFVHPSATWHASPTTWWTPKDMMGQYRRRLRQAQGVLENLAVREHLAVNKFSPEALPPTISELVNGWIADHLHEARRLFLTQPLTIYAARKLQEPRNWSGAGSKPVLMATILTCAETMRPSRQTCEKLAAE